ncbi:hypothetical protein [Lamprobacter modestohalophilus]|uniref:hypothetical protein n=1 Tax=Lamprobacter modestohalophilus TaxID=1064514 RepID=UPI00190362D0|nr:hypothetical protein [Lamprobacter modestohalophilus]
METIFDHDPTAEELRYFSGPAGKDRYLEGITNDQALIDLASLFAMRGDQERSMSFIGQVSDQDFVATQLLWDSMTPESASRKRSSRAAPVNSKAA